MCVRATTHVGHWSGGWFGRIRPAAVGPSRRGVAAAARAAHSFVTNPVPGAAELTENKTSELPHTNSVEPRHLRKDPEVRKARGDSAGRSLPLRWLELLALFALVPLGFLTVLLNYPTAHFALIPLLWVVAFFLLLVLSYEDGWEHRKLLYLPPSSEALRRVLVRFGFVGAAMALVTYISAPEAFMHLPLHDPWMMLAIGVLYPLLSVVPQGIIYRVFMSQRYVTLFRSETTFIVFTSACFAAGHIIFRNWVALALTFLGGLLFMQTYRRTQSHLLASFEHALYGVFAFAVGLGRFLILANAS